MIKKVELTDDFVLLRPYKAGDVERHYEAAVESTAEVYPWLEWCHPGYSMEESRQWVESRDEAWKKAIEYSFVICDPRDGRYLGACGINRIDPINKTAHLGYWVRTRRTKQGIATAATQVLARFGFKELGLQRISIVVAVGNRASQRVAAKAGAKREGVLRNVLFLHGKPTDAVMFSLVPADLR